MDATNKTSVELKGLSDRQRGKVKGKDIKAKKKKKKKENKPKFDYRKYVDVSNRTLVELLDNFTHVSVWVLPPFKLHHVRILCIILIFEYV